MNTNRHGYYLTPSTGRTQLIRNAPQQQFVNVESSNDVRIIRKYFSSIAPCNETGAVGYLRRTTINREGENEIWP